MRIDSLKQGALALAIVAFTGLAGCSTLQTGGGKNPVAGSAGGANSKNANPTLEHCPKPLGTLAVEEDEGEPWYAMLTQQYHLPSTTPLIRLMIQQSNCFVVVDRGRGMTSMMRERDLAASGELRSSSNLRPHQMVAADYVVTPNIQFSQGTGGGAAGLAGLVPYGALVGAVVGSMKTSEASTTLMLTDTRSGVQVAIAQGSAKNTDFGFGGLFGGAGAVGAAGAYAKTPQGKVIAAAFLDSYNQMVKAVREYAPQHVSGGLGTGGALSVDGESPSGEGDVAGLSLRDAQRKLASLGLYKSRIDGRPGPGTSSALSSFQRIRGLDVTGKLDPATAKALQQ
ncbi:peptidoglycan-binding domain-containing protein [Dyella lutea]|uniref:Peptidoglycan-binding protein n=1 Tax=Dyella lutea TaxID=2950441 RepID=A0ABT1FF41_9GAMM|nr:peptidoglycan-binding domain-containing protein [Dyella lutea]MCP1374822.1 peptidoglycan-binding protein [Dyella lutea]